MLITYSYQLNWKCWMIKLLGTERTVFGSGRSINLLSSESFEQVFDAYHSCLVRANEQIKTPVLDENALSLKDSTFHNSCPA